MAEQPVVRIDGSTGEGGGQILRTALSLSLITGKAFELSRARAARPNPGLRAQHVACLKAAAAISAGEVLGAEVGSSEVAFRPGAVRPGDYVFEIGTAGATTLLAQALVVPLALSGGPSTLKLRGGTHVPHAPSFHYFSLVWGPMVARLGFLFTAELTAAGFYPEGGGELLIRIAPTKEIAPLDLLHRGTLREVTVLSLVGGLAYGIAERQKERAVQRLREAGILAEPEVAPLISPRSKGSMLMVLGNFEHSRAGFSCLGEKGKSAEKVAEESARGFVEFMARGGAVDPYLADQLLIPAALASAGIKSSLSTTRPDPGPGNGPAQAARGATTAHAGGHVKEEQRSAAQRIARSVTGGIWESGTTASRFTTSSATRHLSTNAEIVVRFLDVTIDVRGAMGEEAQVEIS